MAPSRSRRRQQQQQRSLRDPDPAAADLAPLNSRLSQDEPASTERPITAALGGSGVALTIDPQATVDHATDTTVLHMGSLHSQTHHPPPKYAELGQGDQSAGSAIMVALPATTGMPIPNSLFSKDPLPLSNPIQSLTLRIPLPTPPAVLQPDPSSDPVPDLAVPNDSSIAATSLPESPIANSTEPTRDDDRGPAMLALKLEVVDGVAPTPELKQATAVWSVGQAVTGLHCHQSGEPEPILTLSKGPAPTRPLPTEAPPTTRRRTSGVKRKLDETAGASSSSNELLMTRLDLLLDDFSVDDDLPLNMRIPVPSSGSWDATLRAIRATLVSPPDAHPPERSITAYDAEFLRARATSVVSAANTTADPNASSRDPATGDPGLATAASATAAAMASSARTLRMMRRRGGLPLDTLDALLSSATEADTAAAEPAGPRARGGSAKRAGGGSTRAGSKAGGGGNSGLVPEVAPTTQALSSVAAAGEAAERAEMLGDAVDGVPSDGGSDGAGLSDEHELVEEDDEDGGDGGGGGGGGGDAEDEDGVGGAAVAALGAAKREMGLLRSCIGDRYEQYCQLRRDEIDFEAMLAREYSHPDMAVELSAIEQRRQARTQVAEARLRAADACAAAALECAVRMADDALRRQRAALRRELLGEVLAQKYRLVYERLSVADKLAPESSRLPRCEHHPRAAKKSRGGGRSGAVATVLASTGERNASAVSVLPRVCEGLAYADLAADLATMAATGFS
ncbi:hypothetical protein HK405_009796, partial [Cladochytrium tenue]